MRAVFFGVGAVLVIAGVVPFSGMVQLGSSNEVFQVGDSAVEVGDGGIRVTDKGGNNRILGIALIVIGGIGIGVGALSKK